MKKARKTLAVITSMALFACTAVVPLSTDAGIVTDNTRSEFDSGEETVDVRILFNFDAKILDQVKGEAHQKAEELSKEYYDSLDVLKYTELERLSMQREYFNVNYERLSKELMEKAKKDLAKPVLEDIGVEITEDIEYPNYGFILCKLNKEQLSKAENNDIIKSVSVDKDWDNGNYIGTPSIYPVFTGTTSTYVNTKSASKTTTVTVTTGIVTTLEYYGTDMFTDIIKDIDNFTIRFEKHGRYRYLSNAIKDQLLKHKIGDEITVSFEYLKVNDTDTPRIDKILALNSPNLPLGDLNNDGQINAVDASAVLAYYAMISTNKDADLNNDQKKAADVNCDGQVNAVDASNILSYYSYLSTAKGYNVPLAEYIK
ncbi:dockerin type I domain-containing protein [Ruminococcus sp.]|uniref:dockerin type I domain-containing protein n=1 Tax=Ruminococcus sp. TaxID=41978 RepID=UPI0025F3D4E8|nr:dockerin type I domain-containing protein [Ruminococcus sp.]